MVDIAQMNERCKAVLSNAHQKQWKREEIAGAVIRAIGTLSKEDVERIAKRVPEIRLAIKLTQEECFANKNGEIRMIKRVSSEIAHTTDSILCYHEARI